MTDKERYIDLCKKENTICIYAQPWWLDVCCGKDNWDVVLYEKKGNIVGALPFYIKTTYGLKFVTMPKRTQTNGMWLNYPQNSKYSKRLSFEKEVLTQLYTALEKWCLEKNVVFYQQSWPACYRNWSPLFHMGYTEKTRYTYIIDAVNGYEKIRAEYSSGVKNEIKHAQEELTVQETDDIDLLYRFHCMTLNRKGKDTSYSEAFIKAFDEACAKRECRKIYIAVDADGEVHSAMYCVRDNQYTYYLFGGIDPRFAKGGAQAMLLDHAIEESVNSGRNFDFEGSMLPGVEEFFQKFGGTQSPFFVVRKIYSKNPIFKIAVRRKFDG